MDFYDELAWRGLVYDATEGVHEALTRERVTGYIGFDPTSSSLHVGNLLVIMGLARLQRAGHRPIALVGGGTGLIGDPKPTTERALLTLEEAAANVAGVRGQLARFLDFDKTPNGARLVDNADWLTKLGAIEFMRDVGKHFSVNAMLTGRPVVATRLPTGVPWVNQHDDTGLVVPPGDSAALASALRRLCGDAALRARLGRSGRARAIRLFTAERMCADFTSLCRAVAAAEAVRAQPHPAEAR